MIETEEIIEIIAITGITEAVKAVVATETKVLQTNTIKLIEIFKTDAIIARIETTEMIVDAEISEIIGKVLAAISEPGS